VKGFINKSLLLMVLCTVFSVTLFIGCIHENEEVYYTVIFNSRGGTPVDSATVKSGSKVSRPKDPVRYRDEKKSYVFDGWYTSEDKGETLSEQPFDFECEIDGDIVLYAKWTETPVLYTVSFNTNGGSEVYDRYVEYGQLVEKPSDPVRDATDDVRYIFDGWYTSEDEGVTLSEHSFNFESEIKGDIVLYAKWTERPLACTVSFNTNGGSEVYERYVEYGQPVEKPSDPKKNATQAIQYTFDGWYTSEDNGVTLSEKPFDFESEIKDDIVLYAKWIESPRIYTVSFNTKGGNRIADKNVEYGKCIEKPEDPVKESNGYKVYRFDGWYRTIRNNKYLDPFDFTKPVYGYITLYAKWVEEYAYYTIKFDSRGGSEVDDCRVLAGGKVRRPSSTPVKQSTAAANYTFAGWYTSEDNGVTLSDKSYDFNTEVLKEFVLYAKWTETPVVYTVSFNSLGGSSVDSQSVEYGKRVVKPADPSKESSESTKYKFAGWYLSEDGGHTLSAKAYDFAKETVKQNVTLYAKWVEEEIYYTVKFESNGGPSVASQTVKGGKCAKKPEVEMKKDGVIFIGWFTDKECKNVFSFSSPIQKDTVLYAKWQDGFVYVKGAVVVGSVANSGEFIDGRIPLNIPNMYVCDHEVTQKEYEEYCFYQHYREGVWPQRPSYDSYGKGADCPVYYVNFYDALVYCNLRSIAEGLTPVYSLDGETDPSKWIGISKSTDDGTVKYAATTSSNFVSRWNYEGAKDTDGGIIADFNADGYRLPTSVEWEYIAREGNGGIPEKQYKYSGSDDIDEVAWHRSEKKVHPVKELKPNALGIYDMSGNVYEWCWDWLFVKRGNDESRKQFPVEGPENLGWNSKVVRGGGFGSYEERQELDFGAEYGFSPFKVMPDTGFRVVRTAK